MDEVVRLAYERLLQVLSVEARPPSLPALRELTRAFQIKVPFDNIAKLLSLEGPAEERIPSFEKYVDNLERFRIGGTCLTNNPYFKKLLEHLGYQAQLRGADMQKRNVHTCILVFLSDRKYHVDVGYGAHLMEPIDLAELPAEVRLGKRRYSIETVGDRVEVGEWDGDVRRHGYAANPGPMSDEDFRGAVLDSYLPGSTFLNCLRIVKQTDSAMLSLTNRRITTFSAAGTVSKEFDTMAELEACIYEYLGMPSAPVRAAVDVLRRRQKLTLFD